jgi:hypothetical protein
LSWSLRALPVTGERAHAARAQVRQRGGEAGNIACVWPPSRSVNAGRDAAVRDVQHERADLLLEELHRQVGQRALPADP